MLQIVTKCNISYAHFALLTYSVKCILFVGAVPGSRPWRAVECPRPGGLGDGLEAPNEPARRAPYEGVAADQQEAAEPEEDDRASAGAWMRGFGALPNKTLREAGLIGAVGRGAGGWAAEGWGRLAAASAGVAGSGGASVLLGVG
jgi:hypothetical protein